MLPLFGLRRTAVLGTIGALVALLALAAPEKSEWIAIAPRSLEGALRPLAAYRAEHGCAGARVVTLEEIEKESPGVARSEAIRRFLKSQAPRFVLLAGDAAMIPPGAGPAFFARACPTDAIYARDGDDPRPARAVGRFPSSDPAVVARLVERTIAVERDAKPAGWRRRVSFLGADGGFGPALDSALEGAVAGLLDRELPAEYELRVLRTTSKSEFGVPIARERSAILDLWGSGSLLALFAGHGSRHGLHTAMPIGGSRPIFGSDDAASLDVRQGAPFVVFFACHTGDFSQPAKGRPSCLAAALLESPHGALAVLAASEVSHPYGDLLLAHEMNEVFRAEPSIRIGELVRRAKERFADASGPFRESVDKGAELFGVPAEDRSRILEYERCLYNLLGDPAARLLRPESAVKLTAPDESARGDEISVDVSADLPDGASVVVSLELPRSARPLRDGYPAANDRLLDRSVGLLKSGSFRASLRVPEDLAADRLNAVAEVRTADRQGAAASVVRLRRSPQR